MIPPRLHTAPGPGFIATVTAATGIRHTDDDYDLAQLLLTHPGPRWLNETANTVEDGMRSLATALRLGPGTQPPPFIGPQLLLKSGRLALDYGHNQYVMTIPPPSQDWLALITAGAICRHLPDHHTPPPHRHPHPNRHPPPHQPPPRQRLVGHHLHPPTPLNGRGHQVPETQQKGNAECVTT